MRQLLLVFSAVLLLAGTSWSATWDVRLVIRSGNLALAGNTVDYRVYTTASSFTGNSDLFIWEAGDVVNLKVVNEDAADHGFKIDGYADYGTIIPGDSVEQQLTFGTEGIFRYYDPVNAPYNSYMGLSGVIHIKAIGDAASYFYWDLREHQPDWNLTIPGGGTPALSTYAPIEFTINGNHNPDINSDVIARITGSVGNEFRVVIVNNGLSIHSLHFHGYHLSIMKDSRLSQAVGRSKDTFPVFPGQHLLLSCTPDKPGEYPVHDHNLSAVSGDGMYAKGMFSTLLIAP